MIKKKSKKSLDKKLLNHIQTRKWGNFDNKGMDLLIRSIQLHGFRKFQKNAPRKMISEDIFLHRNNDKQLKAYSLESFFSKKIIDWYLKRPSVVEKYIKKSYATLENALGKIEHTKEIIAASEAEKLVEETKKLLEIFFEVSYWKYYITAISIRLSRHQTEDGKIKNVLEKISAWKNDEKFYGFEAESLIEILHFLSLQGELGVHGWEISKYIHVNEFMNFLNNEITGKEIADLIKKREEIGYISLNLEHSDYENVLLCNSTQEAQEIIKHIEELFQKENKKNIKEDKIFGISVGGSKKIIEGQCVVIKNHTELDNPINLDGKILVTAMSTPKYLPYIKNIKAIITDTGGVMCHAAIITRELNIPCIVGTNIATEFLKTGDRVEVDLGEGMIRKIN